MTKRDECPGCHEMKDARAKQCRSCADIERAQRPCSKCGEADPKMFGSRPTVDGKVRRRGACKNCEVKANGEYRQKNPEAVRERKRKWAKKNPDSPRRTHFRTRLRKWGYVLLEPILQWWEGHGPECDICNRPAEGYRWDRLHVDHDEKSGAIRGMLCGPCNLAIGNFEHDVERMEAAVEYLKRVPLFLPDRAA